MPRVNNKSGFKILPLLETAFLASGVLLAIVYISVTLVRSEGLDFDVFYFSARQVIQGKTIYDTYGAFKLPYWYFPWVAWFYVPLAFFSRGLAYGIYMGISILCATITINFLYQKTASHTNFLERLFALSMSMTMCWLLFRVGQMDYILLAVAVAMIQFVDTKRSALAGLLVPILLFKPHLFLLFFVYLALKGRKSFIISAITITAVLMVISFLAIPNWPHQMLNMLKNSGQRIDHTAFNFTTLPNLFGSQENWSGTANLPFTVFLILIGLLILWYFRSLDPFSFLTLSLVGSLFCAPRAYAYNFPLLIPVMVWLSAGLSRGYFILFWAAAGVTSILLQYSTKSYLIVLAIFAAGIYKALQQQRMINQAIEAA